MKNKIIDNKMLEILQNLINKEISMIYSNSLHYNLQNDSFEVLNSVICAIEPKRFISLSCVVSETIEEVEYYSLNVNEQIYPEPLPYEINEYNNIVFTKPISGIEIWSRIKEISILSPKEYKYNFSCINFKLENSKVLSIWPHSIIAFNITFNDEFISKRIKNCIKVLELSV